jgi:hypothetical protein
MLLVNLHPLAYSSEVVTELLIGLRFGLVRGCSAELMMAPVFPVVAFVPVATIMPLRGIGFHPTCP